jgi:hypothetical protein
MGIIIFGVLAQLVKCLCNKTQSILSCDHIFDILDDWNVTTIKYNWSIFV